MMDTNTPQLVFDERVCMDAGWKMDPQKQESVWHAADVALPSMPAHHDGCSMGKNPAPCDPVPPVPVHGKPCELRVGMTAKTARSIPRTARRTLRPCAPVCDSGHLSRSLKRRCWGKPSFPLRLVQVDQCQSSRALACADDFIQ